MKQKIIDIYREYNIFAVIPYLLIAIMAIPTYFMTINSGLDNSGVFVLNEAMGRWTFGSDIMFTYGPLGFLVYTIPIHNNLIIYLIFYMVIYGIFLYALAKNFKGKKRAYIVISSLLFLATYTFLDATYFVEYVVLLLLNVCLDEKSKTARIVQYVLACLIAALMFFVKFNALLALFCTIILFLIIIYFTNKNEFNKYLICTSIIPIICIIGYLLYNPSFTDLFRYVRSILEISSGFNVAMSLVPQNIHLYAALVCLACCLILLGLEWYIDFQSAKHTLLFAPIIFFAFKHGFVRADGHIVAFFSSICFFMSIKCLYMTNNQVISRRIKKWFTIYSDILMVIFVTPIIISFVLLDFGPREYIQKLQTKTESICNINQMKNNVITESPTSIISDEIKNIVGNETVAIYPIEQSMIAYNNSLNFTVMPLVQAYSVYTPYLDKENAEFFIDKNRAPEYIIFDMNAIDGRLFGIECPQTWNAIYNNYITVYSEGSYLLLKRTEKTFTAKSLFKQEDYYNISQKIYIPQSIDGTYVSFSAEMELSALGKLKKLLYQIPEVTLTIEYESGRVYTGRIIPDNLTTPFVLNHYSQNIQNTGKIINGIINEDKIVSIQFGGEGLKYYKDTTLIKFENVTRKENYGYWGVVSKVNSLNEVLEGLTPTNQQLNFVVDYIQGNLYSDKEQHEVMKNEDLNIIGWILDEKQRINEADVYLILGESCYLLEKNNRADVGDFFGVDNCDNCGYTGYISYDDLPKGVFTPKLMLVYPDGQYTIGQLRQDSILVL